MDILLLAFTAIGPLSMVGFILFIYLVNKSS